MMMRPRNYGTLNRSIARSVSYSLRNVNRGRTTKSKLIHNNSNISEGVKIDVNDILIIIFMLLVLVGLAYAFPILWIVYIILLLFV